MGHTYTILGTSTGETYEVLRTDVGSEDSHTNHVPRLALTEEVSRRVFALLGFLIFPDSIPYGSYHSDEANDEYYPVEPNEFM